MIVAETSFVLPWPTPTEACHARSQPPRLDLLQRSDKRRCDRIRFEEPVSAQFARRSVRLLDLSTLGARIEHPFPLPIGAVRLLEFELEGESLALQARVVRSRFETADGSARFCSGVLFLTEAAASEVLWGLLVSRLIDQLRY